MQRKQKMHVGFQNSCKKRQKLKKTEMQKRQKIHVQFEN